MSQTQCPKCRNVIEPNDKFCPHCGAPVLAESQEKKSTTHCPKCNHENPDGAAFCEKCGASLAVSELSKNKKSGPQTYTSTGTYSGKMTKGKTSRGWKRMRTAIVVIILLLVVAIAIWFAVDPDAGEKLKNIGGGILVAAIFIFFVIRGNKGKRKRGSGYEFEQGVNHDDDYDDDFSDDGGDDD